MFLWYRQINDLMGTSPLVDKSALTHSASVLDLTVLTASSLNESIEDEVRWSLLLHISTSTNL